MDDAWQSQDIAPTSSGISIPTADALASGTPMNTDEQGWNNSGSNNDGGGRSPRERSGDAPRRSRSRSPGANRDRDDRGGRRGGDRGGGEGGAGVNPGNNLHVSGLSHKVDTRELEAAFSKIGRVQKASVMYDPHTRESRGFGFVTMETAEEADAAITALNTTELMGKVMNVEKARRGRARTPTPGRYYGPPKRGDSERPYDPRPYDSRYSRDYDDRRGGRGRYDDHRGGRDHDRHRDYDRGDRDRDYDGGRRGGYDDRRDRGGRYDSGRY